MLQVDVDIVIDASTMGSGCSAELHDSEPFLAGSSIGSAKSLNCFGHSATVASRRRDSGPIRSIFTILKLIIVIVPNHSLL